jgi:hypothetical protein
MKPQSIHEHTVTIDDKTYVFRHVSPRELTKVFVMVLGMLGQPMVDNLDNSKLDMGSLKDAAKNGDMVKEIVKAITACMKPEVVDPILDTMFSQCTCIGIGNVKENFDIVFNKRLIHMYKVLFEAVKYYYSDFLDEGLELVTKLIPAQTLTQGK